MTIPASLVPTLDALLSNSASWLPLGDSPIHHLGDRFLRAGHQSWFDVVVVRDGVTSLAWTKPIESLLEFEPTLFTPALEHGVLQPIAMRADFLERARFVDEAFPALWASLERGEVDCRCVAFEAGAVLRMEDGRYWNVDHSGGVVAFAKSMKPEAVAYSVRSNLWKGSSPPTRPLAPALPQGVAQATAVETILKAGRVEVMVGDSTRAWHHFRLSESEAFFFTETGEERPSADYTSPYPETVYDFLPYPRAQAEQILRDPSAVVHEVDYRT